MCIFDTEKVVVAFISLNSWPYIPVLLKSSIKTGCQEWEPLCNDTFHLWLLLPSKLCIKTLFFSFKKNGGRLISPETTLAVRSAVRFGSASNAGSILMPLLGRIVSGPCRPFSTSTIHLLSKYYVFLRLQRGLGSAIQQIYIHLCKKEFWVKALPLHLGTQRVTPVKIKTPKGGDVMSTHKN